MCLSEHTKNSEDLSTKAASLAHQVEDSETRLGGTDASDQSSSPLQQSTSPYNHTSFKKNREQTRLLDIEFDKNPNWNKAKMRELAEMLGLKDSQIYKWHWDRSQTVHKRFQKNLRKINNASKSLEEGLPKEHTTESDEMIGGVFSENLQIYSKEAAENQVEPNVLTEILL